MFGQKTEFEKKQRRKANDVGNILFNVWNTLTEQPDTRSWQTLPGTVKTASKVVKPGKQNLNLGDQVYQFDVPAQQTTFGLGVPSGIALNSVA